VAVIFCNSARPDVRINDKLNLVIPVDTDSGTVYVHSTPLSREMFEEYFMLVSKTFAAIYRQGLEIVAGPRVAMLLLKQVARELGLLEGPKREPAATFIAEIRRLTNVAIPGEHGLEIYPLQDVVDRDLLDPDDLSEVEGAVTFFMCASAMHRRKELPTILAGMTSLWNAQTTSLGFTAYLDSLPTSTEEIDSPMKTSSVPS
jgi:hypothetical protein